MSLTALIIIGAGVLVGVGAACSGLGGGFLMIPLLLALGFTPQKAVGTTFLGIFLIAASSLVAHNKLAHVDWKYGILLGVGGIIGAQIGARLIEYISEESFRRLFAAILVGLALYVLLKK
jgi:uncharacterized membrane protein YfcA